MNTQTTKWDLFSFDTLKAILIGVAVIIIVEVFKWLIRQIQIQKTRDLERKLPENNICTKYDENNQDFILNSLQIIFSAVNDIGTGVLFIFCGLLVSCISNSLTSFFVAALFFIHYWLKGCSAVYDNLRDIELIIRHNKNKPTVPSGKGNRGMALKSHKQHGTKCK